MHHVTVTSPSCGVHSRASRLGSSTSCDGPRTSGQYVSPDVVSEQSGAAGGGDVTSVDDGHDVETSQIGPAM